MTARIVTWSQDMSSLGPAAVAIGVFDGVHIGHQALLCDTVADAVSRNVQAVAVTFDRDPDQVVSPSTAAPQLLTLSDKLDCISETGIDVILVVAFTPLLAEMSPESFVDTVLLSAMSPVSVHVGRDFRFGSRAVGDVDTLLRIGLTHDFEVSAHDLVAADGAPVTSTRIRALVAAGEVASATNLLCRRPRVSGVVHRGRGEGVKLGFPTANVVPAPYSALPANGVYAGRAILDDGVEWAAAISVGTPPTFPEARDYLEAHLVDFEGDLYGQTIMLEFFARLRDQKAYGSLDALIEAISADVAAALEIAGFDDDDHDTHDLEDDVEAGNQTVVFDPAALAAAEDAVRGADSRRRRDTSDEMVVLVEGLPLDRVRLLAIDHGLKAAGVETSWDPYSPQNAPLLHLNLIGENRFRISVWNSQLELARAVLQDADPAR